MHVRRQETSRPRGRKRVEIATAFTCFLLSLPVLGQARGAAPLPSDAGSIVAVRNQGGVIFTNLNSDAPADPAVAPGLDRGAPAGLQTILDASARRYDLDPSLVREVARQESDFDPRSVSNKGALGVMQLMPETARDLGVRHPFDAAENIDGGARYLKALLQRYDGDIPLTLAAYNAGPGNVDRYGRQVPPYAETRAYVKAITRRLQRHGHASVISRHRSTSGRRLASVHPAHHSQPAPSPVVLAGEDNAGNPVFSNVE